MLVLEALLAVGHEATVPDEADRAEGGAPQLGVVARERLLDDRHGERVAAHPHGDDRGAAHELRGRVGVARLGREPGELVGPLGAPDLGDGDEGRDPHGARLAWVASDPGEGARGVGAAHVAERLARRDEGVVPELPVLEALEDRVRRARRERDQVPAGDEPVHGVRFEEHLRPGLRSLASLPVVLRDDRGGSGCKDEQQRSRAERPASLAHRSLP